MFVVFKVLIATVAISSVIAAGYFYVPSDPEPEYTVLIQENPIYNHLNLHGYDGTEKIGKHYEAFLVSTDEFYDRTTGELKIENSKWWSWSYRRWSHDYRYKPTTLSDEFKDNTKIKRGFGEGIYSLNQVCKVQYEKERTDNIDSSTTPNTKLKNNIFKYCSPLGSTPKTVNDDKNLDEYEKGYGKDKKTYLISPIGNEVFWKLKTQWFMWQGRTLIKDAYFKKFFDDRKKGISKESLKTVCASVYYIDQTKYVGETTAPKDADVLEYCGF